MGGRKQKKKQIYDHTIKEVVPSNYSAPARNLRKADLGAVIFGCTHNTINECMTKNLFGLPKLHYSYIKNISQGLVLFLFNYSDRKLHGIFEAASPGQMSIDNYAWVTDEDDKEYTSYPAQVRICVRKQCQPLSETEFKPIIASNYYESKLFYFELDHGQTKKLLKLFKSSPVHSTASFPPISTNLLVPNVGMNSLPEYRKQTSKFSYASIVGSSDTTTATVSSSVPGKKWSALFKTESACKATIADPWGAQDSDDLSQVISGTHDLSLNQEEDKGDYHSWEESHLVDSTTNEVEWGQTCESDMNPEVQENTWEEKTTTVTDDSQQGNTWEESKPVLTTTNVVDGQTSDSSGQPLDDNPDCQLSSSTETDESDVEENNEKDVPVVSNTVTETSTDLYSLVDNLIQEVKALKGSQTKQIVKINMLEQEMVISKQEIQHLRNYIGLLESGSRTVVDPAEVEDELLNKTGSTFVDSVYIVGGHDGSSWLTTLDSYFPSHDTKISLSPMQFVKKYATSATLNGELYHFGGEGSPMVESFNPKMNQWISRPPLYWKNVHVAGASINNRLYVVGGAKGLQCSSEVEYLDLSIGKWLPDRAMLRKRLAPAAVKLNNALYVTGGFDGVSYSSSVERFDPREERWYELPSMNIYTLGGFDGDSYISKMEYLDTRMGYWVEAEPMNVARGYFGSFAMENKLYAIGGVKEEAQQLDIVECYKEGSCWEVAAEQAIGKRSHFSAIVL